MSKSSLRWILGLLLLSVMGVLVACQTSPSNPDWVIAKSEVSESTLKLLFDIKNEDIIWHGTYIGLMPELTGATLSLVQVSENIDGYLLEALLDEKKFVAAHVLFSFRSQGKVSCEEYNLAEEWCGLKVQIDANGGTTFEGNNLRELQSFWRKSVDQ